MQRNRLKSRLLSLNHYYEHLINDPDPIFYAFLSIKSIFISTFHIFGELIFTVQRLTCLVLVLNMKQLLIAFGKVESSSTGSKWNLSGIKCHNSGMGSECQSVHIVLCSTAWISALINYNRSE